MSTFIDIQKKCKEPCKCSPTNAGFINVKTGSLKDAAGYIYCTHFKHLRWINEIKYGRYELKIEDGNNTPFSTKHSMIWEVIIYYREDSDRTTIKAPLILGLKEYLDESYTWYENLSKGNTTWKKVKDPNYFPKSDTDKVNPKFKNKLDVLSCKLGGIVDIDLSKHTNEEVYCHDGHGSSYNKKVKVALNPNIFGFPNYLTFVHTQKRGNELTIGGFNIGNSPQTVNKLQFPITEVTKITVFMPACDHNKPFLFHIESKDRNNNRWFKRTTGGNKWEEVTTDLNFTNRTLEQANKEVKKEFSNLTKSLGVQECQAPGTVQLDITKIPETTANKNETVYFSSGTPIHVKKTATSTNGFFKLVHSTTKTPFKLGLNIGRDQTINKSIQPGKPIEDVREVVVYFWTGDDNKPILLGIETTNETKYYSQRSTRVIGQSSWSQGSYSGFGTGQLTYMLDEQNCHRNNAAPFDIKNPVESSTSNKSSCIKNKGIQLVSASKTIPGYTVKEYDICGYGTRISRVTFGGQDTKGIHLTKNDEVSRIKVYSYQGPPEIPLMLQFVLKDGKDSKWYYSKDSSGTDWGTVNVTAGFYNGTGNDPIEKLTTELDEITCSIGIGVTLDLTYNRHPGGKYCCNSHGVSGDQKVTITHQFANAKGKAASIPHYKHDIFSGTKLAAIKYDPRGTPGTRKYIKPSGLALPTNEPVTVYVFYCNKGDTPKLIYVSSPGQNITGWYKQNDSGDDDSLWTELIGELSGTHPDNIDDCTKWTQLNIELTKLGCNGYGQCTETPKPLPKVQGPAGLPGKDGPKGPAGIDGEKGDSARVGLGGGAMPSSQRDGEYNILLELFTPFVQHLGRTLGTLAKSLSSTQKPLKPEQAQTGVADPVSGQVTITTPAQTPQAATQAQLALASSTHGIHGGSAQPTQTPNHSTEPATSNTSQNDDLPEGGVEQGPSGTAQSGDADGGQVSGYTSPSGKEVNQVTTEQRQPTSEYPPQSAADTSPDAEESAQAAALLPGLAPAGSVLWTAFGSTSGTLAGSAATFFGGCKVECAIDPLIIHVHPMEHYEQATM